MLYKACPSIFGFDRGWGVARETETASWGTRKAI